MFLFFVHVRSIQNDVPLAGLFGGSHEKVWRQIHFECIYLETVQGPYQREHQGLPKVQAAWTQKTCRLREGQQRFDQHAILVPTAVLSSSQKVVNRKAFSSTIEEGGLVRQAWTVLLGEAVRDLANPKIAKRTRIVKTLTSILSNHGVRVMVDLLKQRLTGLGYARSLQNSYLTLFRYAFVFLFKLRVWRTTLKRGNGCVTSFSSEMRFCVNMIVQRLVRGKGCGIVVCSSCSIEWRKLCSEYQQYWCCFVSVL